MKLSALHPRFEPFQDRRLHAELLPQLIELARMTREAGIGLCFDAEESERLIVSIELIRQVLRDPQLNGYEGVGLAVQAYQKRSTDLVSWVRKQAQARHAAIPVRLVKGAYWDSEIKRAQQLGLRDYPVFTRKAREEVFGPILHVLRYRAADLDALLDRIQAGGTHYPARFAVERLLTTNVAAVGGNADLLAPLHD